MLLGRFGWSGDQRREQRFVVNDPVTVSLLKAEDSPEIAARLVDVSRNGVGIKASGTLDPGSRIKVRWNNIDVYGNVRYCRQEPEGSRVGVSIDYVRLMGRDQPLQAWVEYLESPGSVLAGRISARGEGGS